MLFIFPGYILSHYTVIAWRTTVLKAFLLRTTHLLYVRRGKRLADGVGGLHHGFGKDVGIDGLCGIYILPC